MAEYRCPQHDTIFQTQTDHTKPGTRALDSEGRAVGKHKHSLYQGGVSGHPDCPLCAKGDDRALIQETSGAGAGARKTIAA